MTEGLPASLNYSRDLLLNDYVPMSEVLAEIPVDDAIKKALLGRPSRYRPIFEVVLDYEIGNLGTIR